MGSKMDRVVDTGYWTFYNWKSLPCFTLKYPGTLPTSIVAHGWRENTPGIPNQSSRRPDVCTWFKFVLEGGAIDAGRRHGMSSPGN